MYEDEDSEETHSEKRIRKGSVTDLFNTSRLPLWARGRNPEKVSRLMHQAKAEAARGRIEQIVASGGTLVMFGGQSREKTLLATAVGIEQIMQRRKVRYIYSSQRSDSLEGLIYETSPHHLVIIDHVKPPIGIQRNLVYLTSSIRHDNRLPTILISDVGLEDFAELVTPGGMRRCNVSGGIIDCDWPSSDAAAPSL